MTVPFFFSAPELCSALQFCWTGNDKLLANEYYANANTQAIESSPQLYASASVARSRKGLDFTDRGNVMPRAKYPVVDSLDTSLG
jgi:hypothetical protein